MGKQTVNGIGGILRRVIWAVFAGAVAALGAYSLGIEWQYAWSLIAVPAVFGVVNVLAGPVSTFFLLFGLCALVWSYTPLREVVKPLLDRAKIELPQVKPPTSN